MGSGIEGESRQGWFSKVALTFGFLIFVLMMIFRSKDREKRRESSRLGVSLGPKDREIERESSRQVIRGWLFVIALAVAFFIYGVTMFFVVGDKGPPDWGFGEVEDIPGQSIYSTNPAIPGPAGIPQPQHVYEKPSLAEIDVSKTK